ncbi:MAG: Vps62-related protein [Pseudomonadota bacterium]
MIGHYAPMVVLHPEDVYRPTSVEEYLTGVRLVNGDNPSDTISHVTAETLAQHSGDAYKNWYLEQTNPAVKFGMPVEKRGAKAYSPAPMYYHQYFDATARATFIVYAMFYGFNGSQSGYSRIQENEIFKTHHKDRWWTWADFAQHESDWEHVVVRIPEGQSEPDWLRLGRHHSADGEWVRWSEIPKWNGHPFVYSALHSHGVYKDQRGFGNDKSGKYQPSGSYRLSKWLVALVNSMPGNGPVDYFFEEIVFGDQTVEHLPDLTSVYWTPWNTPNGLVEIDPNGWAAFEGMWAPSRNDAADIHDPTPHLPGHLHMKMSQAAKLAKFLNALPEKYRKGGRPVSPLHQDWWSKQPPLPAEAA